ncbi:MULTISPECIES: MFS transporter [unclassified Meridianimarinicoccus]|uniref:MFS transporter n=1 Tax=unclassified Meridianimarinicoccus TaxID=2923344 RepID=UPI0018696071|nr:MFS transporter [Fluviibacterium sp. MJW13]
MNHPLRNPQFRRLFAAQILSLTGVGILTVSLALSAYDFGGISLGGTILGGILALKMVAYVLVSPVAEAALSHYPRRPVLAMIDLMRMGIVALMALAVGPWQVAGLAFVFFAFASGFTPLFQSVIADMIPDEAEYARALALSRLAYTLESILSPVIAALALNLIAPGQLFFLASLSFAGSIVMLMLTRFPALVATAKTPFRQRLPRGLRIYLRTPRLRGLWLMQFALSLMMAWVLVNSVIYAAAHFETGVEFYPRLMTCYGMGAAVLALLVPRLLDHASERRIMTLGVVIFAALGALVLLSPGETGALVLWFGFGAAASLVLTPGGLIITRSSTSENRPAVFAAQFALSHAGWLLAYPAAGLLGAAVGPAPAMAGLCIAALLTLVLAARVWVAEPPAGLVHEHPELPEGHPHLREHYAQGHRHRHRYFIDDLHPHWPGSTTA